MNNIHLLCVTVTVTLSEAEFPLSSSTVSENMYWPFVRLVAFATDSLKFIMLELVGPDKQRQVYATIRWSSCEADPFSVIQVWGSDINCNYKCGEGWVKKVSVF